MLIEQPARWLRLFYPHALWRMDKNDHSVYLTFDDGPIPEATPFILDVLDEFGAKAMFFMVADNVRKHPDLYKEVIRRGHKVGNHTYHHLGSFRHWTLTYAVDVTKADNLLNTPYFRPPHGWLRHTVYWWVKQNYRVVMWDLVTRDYSKLLTAKKRGRERKTICKKWVYHYLPRLFKEYRQAPYSTSGVTSMAQGTGI